MWPTCLQHKVHHKFNCFILKRASYKPNVTNNMQNAFYVTKKIWQIRKLLDENFLIKIKRHILVEEWHIEKTNLHLIEFINATR